MNSTDRFWGLRPGDALVAVLLLCFWFWILQTTWLSPAPTEARVYAGGALYARLRLDQPKALAVPGPLGETRIEVMAGKVRVASDPGPRQLCVRQGWLSRAGDAALCLPNRVSVVLTGGGASYDSLSY